VQRLVRAREHRGQKCRSCAGVNRKLLLKVGARSCATVFTVDTAAATPQQPTHLHTPQYRRKFIPDEGTTFQDFKFVSTASGSGPAASKLLPQLLHVVSRPALCARNVICFRFDYASVAGWNAEAVEAQALR
jgi:hypothetical protein